MLKSDILKKLEFKHQNLSESDIEQIFNIFIKKIVYALKNDKNVELKPFRSAFVLVRDLEMVVLGDVICRINMCVLTPITRRKQRTL